MTEWSAEQVAPKPAVRGDVQRLVAAGAQLVEVLPRDEYDEEHLPGALHVPLKALTRDVAERTLDRDRPVIVYCWDAL
jgi:rhodanese-related sulfurtransferase